MGKTAVAMAGILIGISLCAGCQEKQNVNQKQEISVSGAEMMTKSGDSDMQAEKTWAQPNNDPVTICVDARYQSQIESLVEAWEYLNEGVHASMVVIPSDASAAELKISELKTALMAGGGPDLFVVSCQNPNVVTKKPELFPNPVQVMESGAFLPLDDYISRAQYMDPSEWNQTVLEVGKTKQGQMALPMYYEYYAYAFNADDLKELTEIPSTWDELAVCEHEVLSGAVEPYCQFYDIFGQLVDAESSLPAVTEEELLQRALEAVDCKKRAGEHSDRAKCITVKPVCWHLFYSRIRKTPM